MRPFRAYFSDFDLEASVLRSTRILKGFEMAQPREPGRSQAPIAAISGLTPRMFMARVRL